MKIGSLFTVASTLLFCAMVEAAEIKVLSTRATGEFYRELIPQFEAASGDKVTTTFTGTLDLQTRIAAGETYDVIIMVDTAIDNFIRSGKVISGSRVDGLAGK